MINAPDVILVKRHDGPVGLPRRGLPRRRPRRPHAHQDPRRRLDAATASSTRPRVCRTRSSTTARACTSSTATSAGVVTSWSTSAGSPASRSTRSTSWSARDMLERARGPLPDRLRARRALDRVRRGARIGQDDPAVVLRGRARPGQAGRHRRGGVRGRRPAGQRGRHADPGGPGRPPGRRPAPAGRRASCAWRPTWPSWARSATARRCRCCSRCRRGSRGSPRSTPVRPARPSPACGSSASWPTPATSCPCPPSTAWSARPSTSSSTAVEALTGPRVTEVIAVEDLSRGTRRDAVHRHRPVRPTAGPMPS